MSFLKRIFGGKSFEDELRHADALFEAGDLGQAKLSYDRARPLARDDAAAEAIDAKVGACCDGIAQRRLVAAREYLEGGAVDMARAEIEGAIETARSEAVRAEAERALEAIERDDAVEKAKDEAVEMSDEERFAVLAGGFEDAQYEEYDGYGDALVRGLLAMQDGNAKVAREALEPLLEEAGEEARFLHLEVARARALDGDTDGSEQSFRAFLETLEPEEGGEARFSAHTELARIADERGDFEGAVAEYERAMDASDEDPRPFLALGQFLRAHGHAEEARDVLLPALPMLDETRPDWRFFHELGLACKDAGDDVEARRYLERVLQIMTTRQHHDFPPATVVALSQILEKDGELERAASLYRALTLGTDRANHWLFHREAGRLLRAAGLDGEAERMFQRASALAEHDENARRSIAVARGDKPASEDAPATPEERA